MSKAVLVMDKPESCLKCKIGIDKSCDFIETYVECPIAENGAINEEAYTIPKWCPMKPIPEKKEEYLCINDEKGYCEGWNACIDAITQGDEE